MWVKNRLYYLKDCMFVVVRIMVKEKKSLRGKEKQCLEISQIG